MESLDGWQEWSSWSLDEQVRWKENYCVLGDLSVEPGGGHQTESSHQTPPVSKDKEEVYFATIQFKIIHHLKSEACLWLPSCSSFICVITSYSE